MASKSTEAPVGLGGNLCDFGVAEVLQLVGQQRKTGLLRVERPRQSSLQLSFDEGRVVRGAPVGEREDEFLGDLLVRCDALDRAQLEAMWVECDETVQSLRSMLQTKGILTPERLDEFESLLTQETLFMLLQLSKGAFSFTPKRIRVDRERASLLGAEQILMDGLRMVDEWAAFAPELPSEELVYEITLEPEALIERLDGRFSGDSMSRERAQQMLRLINGERSVRQVVDCSRLGTFEGMRIFVELVRAGLIEARVFSASAGSAAAEVSARSRSFNFVTAAVAVLHIAALLPLALFSPQQFLPAPAEQAGVALERDRLEELRVSLETLRVERILAASRWARLDELVDAGFAEQVRRGDVDGLISSEGRPYYYLSEDGRVIPLAPARVVSRTP